MERWEELKAAGMVFDPDPPTLDMQTRINGLAKGDFDGLLASTPKMSPKQGGPQLQYNGAFQLRTTEE